jgi:hypothetical protein
LGKVEREEVRITLNWGRLRPDRCEGLSPFLFLQPNNPHRGHGHRIDYRGWFGAITS